MWRILFVLLLTLTACVTTSRNLDVAPAGEKRLVMWHKPSGERIDVIYRINGHYDPSAFSAIDHIFRDRHTGEEYPMDPALIDVITDLRDKMIMPDDTPIELTSGYRSVESNNILRQTNRNAAKNSYHTKGSAADIRIPGMIPRVLELVATTMQRGGVALYPDSGHVHVDVGPIRGWVVKPGREDGTSNEGPTREVGVNRSSSSGERSAAKPFKPAPVKDVLPMPAPPALHGKALQSKANGRKATPAKPVPNQKSSGKMSAKAAGKPATRPAAPAGSKAATKATGKKPASAAKVRNGSKKPAAKIGHSRPH